MVRRAARAKDDPAPPGAAGRPRWTPTAQQREQVKTLAGRGVPHNHIAAILGCDKEALRRECATEIEAGKAIAIANVCGVLYANAVKPDHQHFKDRQFYLVNVAGFDSEKVAPGGTLEELVRASMAKPEGTDGGA